MATTQDHPVTIRRKDVRLNDHVVITTRNGRTLDGHVTANGSQVMRVFTYDGYQEVAVASITSITRTS